MCNAYFEVITYLRYEIIPSVTENSYVRPRLAAPLGGSRKEARLLRHPDEVYPWVVITTGKVIKPWDPLGHLHTSAK